MFRIKTRAACVLPCVLAGLVAGGWIYCHMEVYCFFYPAIDTTFADKYSEAAFQGIRPGMTGDSVQQRLGKPLYIVESADESRTWWYSRDGRCWFGDFAWLGRSIDLMDSVVVRTESAVYED